MPIMKLDEKIAQLFMVGSDLQLEEEIEPFVRYGLGGLILFRNHLQPFNTAIELKEYLSQLSHTLKRTVDPFIAIDQEGGQVERLPHWLFPTGILPVAFGLKQDVHFCEQVNREVSQRLRWLGFNVNFTPTVDLDLELMNPIIGVRAYGSKAKAVIPYARAVIQAHLNSGVLPVAKHFPGHGSGTVDSHLSLPVFERWEETELAPYEALIPEGLPAVLVAHGLYPVLSRQLGIDGKLPASLSPGIVQSLLRGKMGFNGLVFTDDLMMGAVWNDADPSEVAVLALKAGADVLVYRRAQPEAWQAYEAILSRVRQGKLSEALIDEKIQRILAAKTRLGQVSPYQYAPPALTEEACHEQALQWAQKALVELHHDFISPLPLSHTSRWALIAPDRATMRHYGPDQERGKDLLGWSIHYGIAPQFYDFYPVEGEQRFSLPEGIEQPLDAIVFVAFNSHLNPMQQEMYKTLKSSYPNTKMILASAGMPSDREVLPKPWIHVQLPSYRPAAIQAFVQWLITKPGLA